jgi:hypothetical protein
MKHFVLPALACIVTFTAGVGLAVWQSSSAGSQIEQTPATQAGQVTTQTDAQLKIRPNQNLPVQYEFRRDPEPSQQAQRAPTCPNCQGRRYREVSKETQENMQQLQAMMK